MENERNQWIMQRKKELATINAVEEECHERLVAVEMKNEPGVGCCDFVRFNEKDVSLEGNFTADMLRILADSLDELTRRLSDETP